MSQSKKHNNKVELGDIRDITGEINIAAGDIYKGYTVEQVSVLVKEITTAFQPKPFEGRCPYKGLDFFEETDANLFFGRERLVHDLVRRVKESRTVFLTGPSGSGKSSLVRAGLIPALKQGAIPGSNNWLYANIKPGREPISELAHALARLAKSTNAEDGILASAMTDHTIFVRWCDIALEDGDNKRVVLFVDQFEEIFTQVSNETERIALLNMLMHAGKVENGRVILLLAMRSDFVAYCASYPQLNSALNQQFFQIGSMQPDELVSAIAQPALQVGLRVDPDLIAQIINDMKGEPGALPLMQFALKDLFDSRQDKSAVVGLTLEDYLRKGGIYKALERHADDSFAKLNEPEQQMARSIFGKLIEIGHGTPDTRRTALFNELVPADADTKDVMVIVRKLADARLITTDQQAGKDTVTVSHEKLIDAWPWLKKLVSENRDVIALQNDIAEDAKEWETHQRDKSYLYTGARLANARARLDAKQLSLSGTAYEFLQAGILAFANEQARRKRLQKQIVAGLSGTIIVILTLLLFALLQLKISRALQLAALAQASFAEQNYNLSALYAYQSNQIRKNDSASHILEKLPYENFPLGRGLFGHSTSVDSVAWSAEGRLASGSDDGTVIIWDLITSQPAQILKGHTGGISSVAWSKDGRLASGSDDGTVIIWDLTTGRPAQILEGHTDQVRSVAWSADRRLASGSIDNNVIIWDLSTGQPAQILKGHTDFIDSVAWSADGRLASGSYDDTVIVWDLTTGGPAQTLRGHADDVDSVAWSADGHLASGSYDSNVIIWDLTTGQPAQILKGHTDVVNSVAWSADGRLASGSWDNTVIIWDLTTGQSAQIVKGHNSLVLSIAWSTDGRLASGSYDGTAIVWDLTTDQPAQTLRGHANDVRSVDWSTDGRLASGSDDGTTIVWDLTTGQPAQVLKGHTNGVTSVAWSADGRLASGSYDGTVIIWDLTTGQPAQVLKGHTNGVTSIAWSPDGHLASGSYDNTVIIWDLTTSQPAQTLRGHTDIVTSVAWSANGRLASGSQDDTIIVWDLTIGQPSQILDGHTSFIFNIAWSGDGRLASGSLDNTVIVWDLTTGQPAQTLKGHIDTVTSVAWSVDDRLASGSWDNTVIIWDLTTGQPAQTLRGHTDYVESVTWSADGRLASGSEDGMIKISRAAITANEPCDWIYRNLTADEWISNQGMLNVYKPACASLPVPTINPIEEYRTNIFGMRWAMRYAAITWKGRFALLCIVIVLVSILVLLLCRFYELAIRPRLRKVGD